MEKYILGISAFYHDSSAVLLKGTNIIAAAQEERFSRIKFDNNFPEKSISYCLSVANIKINDVAIIAFYEEPEIKWDRIFSSFLHYNKPSLKRIKELKNYLENKFFIEHFIYNKYLKDYNGKIIFTHHHISHASSAFYPSPFKKATIITIDAIGEWSCSSIGLGDKEKISILKEQKYPHSLGFIYSAFTQFLGFKVNSDEFKVMGLAAYGEANYVKKIKNKILQIYDDGSINISTNFFNFMKNDSMINHNFENFFGFKKRNKNETLNQLHCNVAASIQKICEEIVEKITKEAIKITGLKNVVYAGGVAHNSVANGKLIYNKIVDEIWIQPSAGDSGGALGAALYIAYNYFENKRVVIPSDSQKGSLLGPSYSNKEIRKTLNDLGYQYVFIDDFDKICEMAVEKICKGNILGFFQDRMEYGPRALGSRSIIADARNVDMQKILNKKIKFRESFRPFAPIILEEKTEDWFEKIKKSPYMLLTTKVKKDKLLTINNINKEKKGLDINKIPRSLVPSITHVDNSSRLQTINKHENRRIYQLLKKFEQKTNCPILINTSFNIMDEPIVCNPTDALNCFMKSEMDILIIGNFVLEKRDQKKSC